MNYGALMAVKKLYIRLCAARDNLFAETRNGVGVHIWDVPLENFKTFMRVGPLDPQYLVQFV
jgi:hypothetical protein